MSSLDSHEDISKPTIEPANGGAVLVSSKHAVPELGIANSDGAGVGGKIDSDRVQNILMQCFWEIGVKQVLHDLANESLVARQLPIHFGCETALHIVSSSSLFFASVFPRLAVSPAVRLNSQRPSFCSRQNGYSG